MYPDLKQIHPCCDHRNFGFVVLKPKAEACPEQEDRQEREGEEEQIPPAPAVNREHSRQSEDPIQDTRAHRCQKSRSRRVPGLNEYRGTVVRNHYIRSVQSTNAVWRNRYTIDTTKLLTCHT